MEATVRRDGKYWEEITSKIYVEAEGKGLPDDFLVIKETATGMKRGIKPVRTYADGVKLVENLRRIF